MPRTAYVNGRYLPLRDARVSIEDRGYQFADGVYEVTAVLNRRLLDWEAHLDRLERSLAGLEIAAPASRAVLGLVAGRLLSLNGLRDGLLYIQVTRGVAPRDHGFPEPPVRPALAMTVRPFDFTRRLAALETGIAVALFPDERWARPDIKSISLLPNVLAKQAAKAAGAAEVWLVRPDGSVTEGGSTNAWIVTRAGEIVTRGLGREILAGVMRRTLLRLQSEAGLRVTERAFTVDEARDAAEAFITSTTNPCIPVVRIDGADVGAGVPGPVTLRLAEALWGEIRRQTGWREKIRG